MSLSFFGVLDSFVQKDCRGTGGETCLENAPPKNEDGTPQKNMFLVKNQHKKKAIKRQCNGKVFDGTKFVRIEEETSSRQ